MDCSLSQKNSTSIATVNTHKHIIHVIRTNIWWFFFYLSQLPNFYQYKKYLMTFLDRDLRGNDFVTDYEKNACCN